MRRRSISARPLKSSLLNLVFGPNSRYSSASLAPKSSSAKSTPADHMWFEGCTGLPLSTSGAIRNGEPRA